MQSRQTIIGLRIPRAFIDLINSVYLPSLSGKNISESSGIISANDLRSEI